MLDDTVALSRKAASARGTLVPSVTLIAPHDAKSELGEGTAATVEAKCRCSGRRPPATSALHRRRPSPRTRGRPRAARGDNSINQLPGSEMLKKLKCAVTVAANGLEAVENVALTANAMAGDEEKRVTAGCNGYLAKPFTIADLRTVVERVRSAATFG